METCGERKHIMEQEVANSTKEKMESLNSNALTYFLDSLKSLKSYQDLREQPVINRQGVLS